MSSSACQPRLDGLQRRLRLGPVGGTGLPHTGPSATALATERRGADLDEVDGVVGGREVLGDADGEASLAVLGDADDGDDAGADLALAVVDQAAQVLRVQPL